jgi:hypothetical protein
MATSKGRRTPQVEETKLTPTATKGLAAKDMAVLTDYADAALLEREARAKAREALAGPQEAYQGLLMRFYKAAAQKGPSTWTPLSDFLARLTERQCRALNSGLNKLNRTDGFPDAYSKVSIRKPRGSDHYAIQPEATRKLMSPEQALRAIVTGLSMILEGLQALRDHEQDRDTPRGTVKAKECHSGSIQTEILNSITKGATSLILRQTTATRDGVQLFAPKGDLPRKAA